MPQLKYQYVNEHFFVGEVGFDPTPLIFQTSAITISATHPYKRKKFRTFEGSELN
jgi:hypothetical protein